MFPCTLRRSAPLGFALALPVAAQAPNLVAPASLPDAPAIVAAAGTQRLAAVAAGTAASLTIFEDNRGGDYDLFGLRVDAAGNAIDSLPFAITKAPGDQTAPQVVWNGVNWLVVYASQYDTGSGYFATQIRAQRVSPQGVVLDPTPLALGADSTGAYFGVASDGTDWLVAWTGFSAGNSAIVARRVSAAGAALDPGGVVVHPASYVIFFRLGVSYAGGSYLVTWSENGARGRLVSTNLATIGPAVSLPIELGVVRGNGAQFLAAWTRQNPAFQQEVVAQRFAANLTPLDANPIVVSQAATSPSPSDVVAAWDGAQWLVGWTQAAWSLRVARFAGGAVLDPGGVLLPHGSSGPFYGQALGALPGGGALATWHQARFGTADDVYAVPFSGAGAAGTERLLSVGTEAQRFPRTTAGGDRYLVTALAERSEGSRIVAWRVDALGQSLDAAPIVVATAAHARLQVGGAGWNGTHFLVAWADGQVGQVWARRLHPDGTWVDPAPIAVQPGFAPDVAAAGGDFLVTALRYPSYPQYVFSYGVRVRGSDGLVLDPTPIAIGQSFAARARVVELGGRWLVVTERHWTHDQNQSDVLVHFVDASGTVTSAGSIGVLNIQDWGSIDVASGGTSALVVGQTGSNWTNTEIHVRRVLPNGTMPAPMFAITGAAPMGQSRGSVAWNGREYVVAYETLQNNAWFYDFEPDVYALRISEGGAQIDANGFPLWNGEDYETRVDGDGLGFGKALYTASVFDDALAAPRLMVRVQRPPGLSGYGTGTAGCAGAHGIDGNTAPSAGNAAFEVIADRGPAPGIGVLLLGTAADVPGTDPGLGVLVHVAFAPPAQVVLATMLVDPTGHGAVALPLPPQPAYYGFELFTQAAFLWAGPCAPSPSGFSTSPGLRIEIQAP